MQLESIPVIETENYLLTEMKEDYASHMFEFLGDRVTMKYLTPHPDKTVQEVAESIKHSLKQFSMQSEIPWVIKEKHSRKIIGIFRLHKLNFWHSKTEMGVVISREYQKKGVMTELLPVILSYCFNNLKLNRVVGDIFAENEGSRKLLLAHGFCEEGVLRQTDFDGEKYHDTVVFSMLRNEYLNLP
ncbi:GNAT family N-acetyltransferase [Rossellomorea vietnamensis]|uniref:GNAT family N-acetyltransferase n=1 Tax=Rossellomorea aquimaris TaxID=189382 RepID=A0A5D4TV24_9BACI|nr:GNAT family protein [Rossellomorea aquimaris]TYS78104.1 GNAT family N-acetyltransferase [Rossellomorea aquimaris]